MEPARDYVSMEAFRLAQQEAEHREERRSNYERRTDVRMDKMELEQLRHRELLQGKDGRNGVMGRVSLAEHVLAWHSKVLWAIGGSLITAIMGAAVKLYGS